MLRTKRFFRVGVFIALVAVFLLFSPVSLRAQVTYTYTGNSFTSVNGNIVATLSDHISITLSLATALAPNLNCATIQIGATGPLLSFNITDGVNSYGLAQNTTVQCISTSAMGQITQWSIGDFTAGAFPYILSTNIPSAGNVNDVSALTTVDFASVRNSPGVWNSQRPTTVLWKGITWNNLYPSSSIQVDTATGDLDVSTGDATVANYGGATHALPLSLQSASEAWAETTFIDTGGIPGPQINALFFDTSSSVFLASLGAFGNQGQYVAHWRRENPLFTVVSSTSVDVGPRSPGQHTVRIGRRADGRLEFWLDGALTFSTSINTFPANFNFVYLVDNGTQQGQIAAFTDYREGAGPTGEAGSTTDFTDSVAFAAATSNPTTIGFGGILPPGASFGGYSQLDVPGASFLNPVSTSFVNVTRANYYSPNFYPQDFIVGSVNQNTGLPNSSNQLVIHLATPAFALGLDLGGLGFSGLGSATITLSSGHTVPIPSLPTVGHTTFVGFISTQPITTLTFATNNDSWVVEDLLIANPILSSCTFSLSPPGQAFGQQGGLGTFYVNTGVGCAWTPTFNDPWLTPFPFLIPHIAFPGGGPTFGTGPGPGKVSFNVAQNAGAARTGSISVGNQAFSVDQASGTPVCTFSINPSHAVIDDLGGNLRVVVTAPSSCVWTATSSAGWLSVATGASGQGTGAVTLRVAVNSGSARTGTATIAGQTFTVSQGGGACGALDVTGETRALGGGYSYIPFTTYLYSGTITVTNTSAQTLHPPLFVVLVGLPNHLPYPSGDGVIGAAQTTCFSPAGDAMYLLPTGDLPPGRATAVSPLFFTQSLFGGISYQLRVLSGTPTH
jgi:hypothetical protein